ncbi:hypothetical protein OB2597_06775 [Pseudooceanicola batsensis HTCC2597]|uniref:Uncharacterized protein n=1 Tax=Pseudooceanicola batsensis (strain ATCC BAA-863 / DSM 15984 / KCTC 12145 / HTCC2597) TaxID=252305 RepID=A3TTJ0_PSEBH|nr:hypothetical protein OB2597_06775 [Pseudooceanicola batsensis HTCC2597]
MVAFAQRDIPLRHFDVARIERARQILIDALVADFAVGKIMRKLRLGFEEALHFDLRAEPPAGKSFKSFSQYRSVRLIPHEQIAVTGCALIAVSNRSLKAPVAVQRSRPHAVDGLFPVLLTLVLRDRGEEVLDKDGVGIFAELDGRAFEASTSSVQIGAELEVCFQPARKTRNIIDDDNRSKSAVLAEISQHRGHAWSCRQAARHIIGKNLGDLIALVLRVLAATGFLRGEAIPARGLFGGRDAAVNDGLLNI